MADTDALEFTIKEYEDIIKVNDTRRSYLLIFSWSVLVSCIAFAIAMLVNVLQLFPTAVIAVLTFGSGFAIGYANVYDVREEHYKRKLANLRGRLNYADDIREGDNKQP